MKGDKYSKDSYMELMALLYELLGKVRKEGLMSIENDIEHPHESPVFAKYPKDIGRPSCGGIHDRLSAYHGER